MLLSDIFFVLFYGFAFGFVAFFVYRFLIKSNRGSTTVIVEQPTVQYDLPVTEVIYPWYSGYTYGPWWGYNWGGGYGGPGYYGSRRHWRPRGDGGSGRPYGSGASGSRGGTRSSGSRGSGRSGGGRR